MARPSILVDPGRRLAAAVLGALLVAGCTDGNGDAEQDTEPVPTSEAVVGPTTTIEVPQPEITTTVPPEDIGLSAEAVFDRGIAGGFRLEPLSDEVDRQVTQQFTADEQLSLFLTGVASRRVTAGGADVAAIVSVAVQPTAALDPEWRADYEAAATAEALRPPAAELVGTEPVLVFPTSDGTDGTVQNLLWRWDNLFVVIAGRDVEVVRDVAFALLDTAVGPFPTTTTTTTTTVPPTTAVEGATTTVAG